MTREKTFCDICQCQLNYPPEGDVQVKREMLPGAEGCFSLNEQLLVYFVAKKLLKLQEKDIMKLLTLNDTGDGNGSTLLYSKMCTRCEIIVNEALELQAKVVTLQKKMHELSTTLIKLKANVDKKMDTPPKKTAKLKNSRGKAELDKNASSPGRTLRNRRVEISSKQFEESDALAIGVGFNYEDVHPTGDTHISNPNELEEIDVVLIQQESKTIEKVNQRPHCQDDKGNDKSMISEDGDSDMDFDPDYASDSDDDSDLDFNFRQGKRKREDEELELHDSNSDRELGTSPAIKNQIASRDMDMSKAFDFQCTSCGKIFFSKQAIRIHELKIHGIKHHFTCPKCPDLKFPRKMMLIEHRDKVHGTKCDKCGKEMSSIKNLRAHLQRMHKMFLSFPCPLCKMVFKKTKQLMEHRRKVHVANKSALGKLPPRPPQTPEEEEWLKMPCEICGNKYLSGATLEKHLFKMHESAVPKKQRQAIQLNCCFCWRSFHLEQRLTVHMKMNHADKANNNANFPCEQCKENGDDNVFHSCSLLLEHLEVAHAHTSIYKCVKCGWPFLNEVELQEHKKVHHWTKPLTEEQKAMQESFQFKCCFCWRAFPDEAKYKRHLQVPRHHPGLKLEFNCDVDDCEHQLKNPFTTVEDLNQHLAAAHTDASLIHKCAVCSWGFVSPYMLELHKLNHVHAIKGRRACPHCDSFSISLQALKSHYNLCHGKHLKLFKCAECGKKFRGKALLAKHVMGNHQTIKSESTPTEIPCDQCGKMYASETMLKKHHRNYHQERQCQDCDKVFESFMQYKKHRKTSHDHEQKHVCPICGKGASNRGALSVHMNFHKERRYECHVCHIRMADLDNMKEHIKRIHENSNKKKVEPSGDFVCLEKGCGKAFNRKDTLDDHVRVKHSDETRRVWSCDKCGKRFKRGDHLMKHQNGRACPGSRDIIIV